MIELHKSQISYWRVLCFLICGVGVGFAESVPHTAKSPVSGERKSASWWLAQAAREAEAVEPSGSYNERLLQKHGVTPADLQGMGIGFRPVRVTLTVPSDQPVSQERAVV
jgi:hypothetical protein